MVTRCATRCFELSVAAASAAGAAVFAPDAADGALGVAVFEADGGGGAACGASVGADGAGAPVVADLACGTGYRATSLS